MLKIRTAWIIEVEADVEKVGWECNVVIVDSGDERRVNP